MAKRRNSRKRTKKGRKRRARLIRGGGKKKFINIIHRLKKLKCKDQAHALSLANDKFIRQFCCHIKRLKHAKLSPKVTAGLKRHAKKIRKLISPKTSVQTKRKMLSQRGGFIPLIIPGLLKAIPAIVASVAGAALSRNREN